jgi:hypothetical protein
VSRLLLPFFIFDLPDFFVHFSVFALLSLNPFSFLFQTWRTFLLILERQRFWFQETVLCLFPWGWFKSLILNHSPRQLFFWNFAGQPWGPTIFIALARTLIEILIKFLDAFVCPLLVAAAEDPISNLPWFICRILVFFLLLEPWLSDAGISVVLLLVKPYSQILDVATHGFSDFVEQVWIHCFSAEFHVYQRVLDVFLRDYLFNILWLRFVQAYTCLVRVMARIIAACTLL